MNLFHKINFIIDNKLKIRYINGTKTLKADIRFFSFARFQFWLNKFLLEIFHLVESNL